MRFFIQELKHAAKFALAFFPGGTGERLRSAYIKRKSRTCGGGIRIGIGVEITGIENIEFGENVSIMKYSSLYAHDGEIILGSNISINANVTIGAADGGKIVLGDDVIIGQNTVLRASDHEHRSIDVPIKMQGHAGGTITVSEGVWISANCVVTRDVDIGKHSIIAAGAVVTKDVVPYALYGGVPARKITMRKK
ncbi:MAG: acyltransferase [Deltaproteobacteria bacterium]|nr:acyltransferase [Candidatus Zymogenaceae bacterium]